MAETRKSEQNQSENLLNLKDIINICLSNWYWFVICAILSLGIASYIVLKQQPVYSRTMSVLIKTSSVQKYSSSDLDQIISKEGISLRNTKLVNEKIFLRSTSVMREVVGRKNLNVQYFIDGRMHPEIIYGTKLPYEVKFLDIDDNGSAGLTLTKTPAGYELREFWGNGEEPDKKGEGIICNLMDTVATPIGRVTVRPSEHFFGNGITVPIHVKHLGLNGVAASFRSRLSIIQTEKDGDVLDISINDISAQRAEDVLNAVIDVYNERWIDDRNRAAKSTSHFIEDRLAMIEEDLGSVDDDISSYKSRNLMPDITSASSMYLAQSSEIAKQLQDLDNEISTAKFIQNYIKDYSSKNELIPASMSTTNANIAAQIATYNEELIRRNSQIANSSEANPYVARLDKTLDALRSSIVSSINGQIRTMETQADNLRRQAGLVNRKIAESPNQAKYLLSVERQQKVKESLYLFLLQKREESELGQAFTAADTKVINPPTGSSAPVAPNKLSTLAIALLIGLLVPFVLLYLIKVTDTRIRTRQDIENLDIPFVGEVPLKYTKKKTRNPVNRKNAKGKHGNRSSSNIQMFVQNGKRDVLNEAFRVLRTNLEFMSKDGCNKIIITSFNVGSGKSFISLNLSAALSINGRKVLLIDADLRRHSISTVSGSPKTGISDYLAGRVKDIHSVIVQHSECNTLNILPVGTVPPNPTELISSKLFGQFVSELEKEYDYIIFDCPPIDIVADTQIVEKQADRTLFIVRSGLFDKSMLPELENLYKTDKFKNISIVLNGTGSDGSLYSYRSGYQYSYKYGYSYYNKGYYSYIKDED